MVAANAVNESPCAGSRHRARWPATLEQQLQQAGLELLGNCQKLFDRGPALLQQAAFLEDFSTQEIDTLGEAMLLVRARTGQILIREGNRGDWMLCCCLAALSM